MFRKGIPTFPRYSPGLVQSYISIHYITKQTLALKSTDRDKVGSGGGIIIIPQSPRLSAVNFRVAGQWVPLQIVALVKREKHNRVRFNRLSAPPFARLLRIGPPWPERKISQERVRAHFSRAYGGSSHPPDTYRGILRGSRHYPPGTASRQPPRAPAPGCRRPGWPPPAGRWPWLPGWCWRCPH